MRHLWRQRCIVAANRSPRVSHMVSLIAFSSPGLCLGEILSEIPSTGRDS